MSTAHPFSFEDRARFDHDTFGRIDDFVRRVFGVGNGHENYRMEYNGKEPADYVPPPVVAVAPKVKAVKRQVRRPQTTNLRRQNPIKAVPLHAVGWHDAAARLVISTRRTGKSAA